MGMNDVSFRIVASKEPYNTLDDLKGKKNRVSGNRLHGQAIAAMGMNPTPTASSEILSSLQQGVVDTTDVEVFWLLVGRLYDVCKNYLQMEAMPVISVTAVSDQWLKKLPPEDREIWLEGLALFQQQLDKRLAEGREDSIRQLKENGCVFHQLSDEDKAKAAQATPKVGDNLRPNQKAFLEEVRKNL